MSAETDSHAGRTSTEGMKAGGFYDLHSEYQRRVIEGGAGLMRESLSGIEVTGLDAFAIGDYGAGTGATSVTAMQMAIEVLRRRAPGLPVCAIHNDVLTNDFTQLFRNVAGDHGYLDLAGGPIYTMAAAGSFFEQVVPDRSVRFAMCSNAAHWTREQRHVDVPEGMYFSAATDDARTRLAALAAHDWIAFLSARAAELEPGGRLLQQGLCRIGDRTDQVSGAKLFGVMSQIARAMVEESLLAGETLDRYTFPVYCRDEAEVRAPFERGGALAGELDLISINTDQIPNPFWELYEREGLDSYVEHYMEWIHAWGDPTMMANLFEPGGRELPPQQLASEFFARLERAMRKDPAASRYDVWVIRLVAERRAT